MSWRQTEALAPNTDGTSRAVNLDAAETAVRDACTKHKLAISAIEPLLSGGTRVVMVNLADADRIRTLFKKQLLTGAVSRTRWVANR